MVVLCKMQFHLLMVILILWQSAAVESLSMNQPTFCPNATWNANGILFTNLSANAVPHGLFVHTNNDTVYDTDQGINCVDVWSNEGGTPIRILSASLSNPGSIFVTSNGDIYVDSGDNLRVELWTINATIGVNVMNVSAQCMGLFIDNNNTLYCSASDSHQVVSKSLNGNQNSTAPISVLGGYGSAANQLCDPNGLFVDSKFNLYVADWCNSRIQKFPQGQTNAITVVGSSAAGTISLNGPTAVILDGNGYLFIADSWNSRIVGSGPYGYRCLLGCSGVSGTALNQFNKPRALGFTSDGSLIVTDRFNGRILKFVLTTNSCISTAAVSTKPTTTISAQVVSSTTSLSKSSTSTVRTTTVLATTLRNTSSFSMSTSLHVQSTTTQVGSFANGQFMNSTATSMKLFGLSIPMMLCMILF